MRHELKIEFDENNKNLIEKCMKMHANSDDVLFDQEYKFDDGVRLAIRICSSRSFYDDPYQIWTEGVLFEPEGAEIAVSDVGDSVYGEYLFFVGDDEYHALVK